MTELKEEHFEVIDANKAKEHKKSEYKPLTYDLFIEESMIDGQGLFASTDIPKGTDLGVSHIQIEKDKMKNKTNKAVHRLLGAGFWPRMTPARRLFPWMPQFSSLCMSRGLFVRLKLNFV